MHVYGCGMPFPPPVGRRFAIPFSQGRKEKRVSEDEMAGQHHWCNKREFGQTPGDSEGQGGLECCSSWGHKESDMAGRLSNKFPRASITKYLRLGLKTTEFYCLTVLEADCPKIRALAGPRSIGQPWREPFLTSCCCQQSLVFCFV